MSYPGEGVEGMYRNDITQVAAYLDHKHHDHYMIFNLSERNYNFDLFHGRVLDYGWPDHHGPPLQLLIDVVSNIDRWVRADSKNVAIVHCLAGRGRTGTAICAYLCYAGYFASMVKALQYYANVRSNKGKGVTQPSQLRYCKYIDIILNRPLTPKPKCVSITRITITPVPNMTSQLGIRPILNIYRYAPGTQELIWTSQKDNNEATFYGPKDGEITFSIPDISPVAGDVMIKLSHVTTWMWVGSKSEVIMRLIMNTSFFAEGQSVITLGKRDLDIAHKDSRFHQNTQLFLYSTVIPDGPPPPKRDWDPEKFDTWAACAKENRARLFTGEPSPSGLLRQDPSTITFHPFSPPDTEGTPPHTAQEDESGFQDNRLGDSTIATTNMSASSSSASHPSHPSSVTIPMAPSTISNVQSEGQSTSSSSFTSPTEPPLHNETTDSSPSTSSLSPQADSSPSLSLLNQAISDSASTVTIATDETHPPAIISSPHQESSILLPESKVPVVEEIVIAEPTDASTTTDLPSASLIIPSSEQLLNTSSSNSVESENSLSPEDMVESPEENPLSISGQAILETQPPA